MNRYLQKSLLNHLSIVHGGKTLTTFLFVLAVPMSECLGKHSCTSSPFPIAILNGTCFFSDSATTSAQSVFGAKTRNSYALVNQCL